MSACVALLRGVNVGKAQRVPMAAFKSLLEQLGCSEVRTLLNSGNATFKAAARSDSGRLAAAIRAGLKAQVDVDAPVLVKTAAEWRQIVAGMPLPTPAGEHARILVCFAADAAALQALAPLQAQAVAPEAFVVTPHAAYLHAAQGILESRIGRALLGQVGREITSRNWATVLKLQAQLDALEAGS